MGYLEQDMPRKKEVLKREILPDPKYMDQAVAKFINIMMLDGKKSVAEKIMYGALDMIQRLGKNNPISIFNDALEKVSPSVEVKSRRVGGATYQVPVEVRPNRQMALAMRWLVDAARKRNEQSMTAKLAGELIDASEERGSAVKKKEDTHKIAEANKAFSHYRF